jgi:hypothetical protein
MLGALQCFPDGPMTSAHSSIPYVALGSCLLPQRRLEDRIRDLAARVCESEDPEEVHLLIAQLRASLNEHIGRLRKLAADKLTAV